jgi:hypothetical protein
MQPTPTRRAPRRRTAPKHRYCACNEHRREEDRPSKAHAPWGVLERMACGQLRRGITEREAHATPQLQPSTVQRKYIAWTVIEAEQVKRVVDGSIEVEPPCSSRGHRPPWGSSDDARKKRSEFNRWPAPPPFVAVMEVVVPLHKEETCFLPKDCCCAAVKAIDSDRPSTLNGDVNS